MDLDEFFAEYWPALVGAVVLFFATVLLWPAGQEELAKEPSVTQLTDSGRSRESVGEIRGEHEEPSLPSTTEQESAQTSPAVNAPEPTFQIIEKVVALPAEDTEQRPPRQYDMSDPEVRSALKKVVVALYEANDCSLCDQARAFLSHNQIPFTSHSVDDPNIREKARRLSGGTELPVLVIDGQVLREYSESSVQAMLTQAVKAKIAAEER
jgi:mycoredoxin